jgi:polyhydroxyalkanoate synthase
MSSRDAPPLYLTDVPLKAAVGRLTHGISPAALLQSWQDWWLHLLSSPGKQLQLGMSATQKLIAAGWMLAGLAPAELDEALRRDKRFAHEAWQATPHARLAQAFLLAQQWWAEAATGIRGVAPHHAHVVDFMARQLLDTLSPSNFVPTNPQVLQQTLRSGGLNLWHGGLNWARDAMLVASGRPPPGVEAFRPGEAVALTPGRVVMRNALAELIQYEATTPTVHAEPVLIVPSWIMKYYILDLSAQNSLVRWLVGQGHTVFMLSWRNPGPEDRELGMDDYLQLGVLDGLAAVQRAQPGRRVHLAGYCLGGTLAAIAAARLAREPEPAPATLTLLAAQTDFEEPGELGLFIDESQVAFIEELMAEQGVLDGRQMAGAFALINSRDLVWSKLVHEYLMGNTTPLDDLHAWNADATRLPARMHSEYLRRLYLDNDLAEGRYRAAGEVVSLADIHLPMFVVGTERDHVSPWRSVYKIHSLARADICFALTTGGHNIGIVNPPRADAPQVSHRIATTPADAPRQGPDDWARQAEHRPGSWWPSWQHWLAGHSGPRVAPLPLGGRGRGRLQPLEAAPGLYVHGG